MPAQSQVEEKARDIILIAFYHFGTRIHSMWLHRPVNDLYTFYQLRRDHVKAWTKTSDLSFLEIFASGNRYAELLDLDRDGKLACETAEKFLPDLKLTEILDFADQIKEAGFGLCVKAVERMLRVNTLEEYTGAKNCQLLAVAYEAYS